ncbi:MAG: nicotinate-nucleotide adenylyltransferase [Burkholderiales bacterium]|jgi:nicotinate-nucleotide adenylyltransferase|nr:nicotinate-nucleotide adenylyltransferase [Burkholderiales bacterium]
MPPLKPDSAPPPIALLGGTFDPVHDGHLGLARDARRALALPQVLLVPARDPPHRPPPGASATHRLAMLELAIAPLSGLAVDDREIRRSGKSYTVLTLEEFRAGDRHRPLMFILGADAFRGLPRWHRWTEILELAHLVVAARPGDPFDSALPDALVPLWQDRRTTEPADLAASPAGRICVVPIMARDISASAIRSAIARGGDDALRARALMPRAVWDYIAAHRLYAA